MIEWMKKRWQFILGGLAAVAGIFTIFTNRKLRAKISVLEGKEEDARLEERSKMKDEEIKEIDKKLEDLRNEAKDVKDEKDLNRLADHFNNRKPE